MKKGLLLFAFAFALALPATAAATPGDLDPSFSKDGYATAAVGPAGDVQVAIDGDGRAVVGATSFNQRRNPTGVVLARFLQSGLPDRSFGDGGVLRPGFAGAGALGDLAVQSNGRIVVAATVDDRMIVARLGPDGALDRTFADDGLADAGFASSEAHAVAIEPGGEILVGGTSGVDSGSPSMAVTRLTAAGQADSSFSGDGRAEVSLAPSSYGDLATLARGPQGDVYLGGTAASATPLHNSDAVLARLSSNGVPDTGFGGGGVTAIDTGYYEGITGIGFDPAGRTVFGSSRLYGGFVGRLISGGFLDTGIGANGIVATAGPGSADAFGVDATGRIVAADATPPGRFGGPGDIVVNRFAADLGGRDPAFGDEGAVTHDFRRNDDDADDLGFADDGRILLAGTTAGNRLLVMRLEVAEGPPDLDADGRLDAEDRCPERWSRNRSGCPRFARRLTMRRNAQADLFEGRVKSRASFCTGGAEVTVFRARPGPDQVIGQARARRSGRWEADAPLKPGTYVAKVARSKNARSGICGAATSNAVTIR